MNVDFNKKAKRTRVGRRIAVNALVDQHPEGPAYRLQKILEETPQMAFDARPVQVSKDMLLRKATELSQYIIQGEYLDFSPLPCMNNNDTASSSSSNSSTSNQVNDTTKEEQSSFFSTNFVDSSEKDLIYNHQSKIIKAKNAIYRTKVSRSTRSIGSTPKDSTVSPMNHQGVADETLFPTYPPHQLISSLRQVFGSPETSKENQINGLSTSSITNFTELARLVTEHPVFQEEKLHSEEPKYSEEPKPTSSQNTTATSRYNKNVSTAYNTTASHNSSSSSAITNMEAIISNACHITSKDPLSHTSIDGLLIASLSILTGITLEEKGENIIGLQVSGPLSTVHTPETFQAVEYPKEIQLFQCDEELIQFLRQSIIAYEERIQKDSLVNDTNHEHTRGHVDLHDSFHRSRDEDDEDMLEVAERFHVSGHCEQSSSSSSSSSSSGESSSVESASNNVESSSSGSSSSESSSSSSSESSSGECLDRSIDRDDDSKPSEEDSDIFLKEEDNKEDSEEESSHEEGSEYLIAEHEADSVLLEQALAFSLNELNAAIDAMANERDTDETTNSIALSANQSKNGTNSTNLPPIPSIPTSITSDIIKRNMCLNEKDSEKKSIQTLATLNPSYLFDFGQMRSSQVLIQILSFVILIMQQRRCPKLTEIKSNEIQFRSRCEQSSETLQGDHLSIHLAQALLHILYKARQNALYSLCDELMTVHERIISDSRDEDDPALNSMEPNKESHIDFEEKGLMRKAAAATYISSSTRCELSHLISKKLNYIQLLSSALWMTLRILRVYLQVSVSSQRKCIYSNTTIIGIISNLFSSTAALETDELLTKSCISESDKKDIISSLMPISLLKESASLWGELSSEIFPLEKICHLNLKLLVEELFYSKKCSSLSLTQNIVFPWSYLHENGLKLLSICRRLRSFDILDRMIPISIERKASDLKPCKPSNQFKFLLRALLESPISCENEIYDSVKKYVFALSAQCNSTLLLRKSGQIIETFVHDKFQSQYDTSLAFDALKIADSMSEIRISADSKIETLEQRAHKVWGSAISSKDIKPRSGVHKWATRLDKCAHGHIFIGISTKKSKNLRTYIGGDENGWGLIGTKALWHWKKKIRNDYGKTFQTGDIVICSLDTDLGTLSYSIVSENAKGTCIEDFGVAFEGLPQVTFYPSVALYERYDRVTIGNFLKKSSKTFDEKEDELNIVLLEEAISYVSVITKHSEILSHERNFERSLLDHICECMLASLASIPTNVRLGSGRLAFNILPLVSRNLNGFCSKVNSTLLRSPEYQLQDGEWRISIGSSSLDAPYSVDYSINLKKNIGRNFFSGFVTCKKNPIFNEKVEVHGFQWGSSIHFIEEWASSGFSRIVTAHLDLDERRFHGSYFNSDESESGSVTGFFFENDSILNEVSVKQCASKSYVLLDYAYCHLVEILSDGQRGTDFCDHSLHSHNVHEVLQSSRILKSYVGSGVLDNIKECFNRIKIIYSPNMRDEVLKWYENVLENITHLAPSNSFSITNITDEVDEIIMQKLNRKGSFSMLSPIEYKKARKSIICVMLHHLAESPSFPIFGSKVSPCLIDIWRNASLIVEDICRVSVCERKESAKDACRNVLDHVFNVSNFFVQFDPANLDLPHIIEELKVLYKIFGDSSKQQTVLSRLDSNSCLELLKYFGTYAFEQRFAVSNHEDVFLSHIHSLIPTDDTPLCYGCIKRLLSKCISSIYSSISQILLNLTSGEIQYYNPYILSCLLSSLSAFCTATSNAFPIDDEAITTTIQNILKSQMHKELNSYVSGELNSCIDAEERSITMYRHFEDVVTESYHSLLQVSVRVLYIFLHHQIAFSSRIFAEKIFFVAISEMILNLNVLERDDEENMKISSYNAILKQCDELGVLYVDNSLDASEKASLSFNKRLHLEDYIETLFHAVNLFTQVFTTSIPEIIEDFIESLIDFVIWSPHNGPKSIFSCTLSIRILRFMRSVLPLQCSESQHSTFFKLCSHFNEYLDADYFVKDDSENDVLYPIYLEAQEIISLLRFVVIRTPESRNVIDSILNEFQSSTPRSLIFGGLPRHFSIGSFALVPVDSLSTRQSQVEKMSRSSYCFHPSSYSKRIVPSFNVDKFQASMIICTDEASEVCEVIIFDRSGSEQETHVRLQSNLYGKLTVRSVRVPCSDMFLVDEFPYVPYTSSKAMLSLFQDAAKFLSEEKRPLEAVLTIKSLVTPLTSTEFLGKMTCEKDESVSRTFQCLLALGADPRTKIQNLSEIEDRFWHVLSLRNVFTQQLRFINSLTKPQGFEDISYSEQHSECLEMNSVSDRNDNNIEVENIEMIKNENVFEDDVLNSNTDSNDHFHYGETSGLREAAIMQMMELGLPSTWSRYALRRVGGDNIEAAIHFILENGDDMERLISESENDRSGSSRRRNIANQAQLLQQLMEMGFPQPWCAEAISATGQNLDQALTWILTNSERLSSMYRDADHSDSDDERSDNNNSGSDVDESSSNVENRSKNINSESVWPDDIVCPIRTISGQAEIDQSSLRVTGTSSGGFTSVGTEGICLRRGKWFYEVKLETSGCIQIGWADSSFADHCKADEGDGCGDGPSSWAYDGWRRYRWHDYATEWGCRWQEGDVVGCYLDLENRKIGFTLNGKGEEIGMGTAFENFRPCGGVYACVSFNRKEKVRFNLGGPNGAFRYRPPDGFTPLGDAVVSQVRCNRKYFNMEKFHPCKSLFYDFSYGEDGHELFSWQHRYFGSDASFQLREKANARKRKHHKNSYQRSNKSDASFYDDIINNLLKKVLAGRSQFIVQSLIDAFHQNLSAVYEELEQLTNDMLNVYSQKLILLLVTARPSSFHDLIHDSTKLWNIICSSCSDEFEFQESGIMYLASELLGFNISYGKNRRSPLTTLSRHLKSDNTPDISDIIIPKSLHFSAVIIENFSSSYSFLKTIEVGLLHSGFSVLVFLKEPMLGAIQRNSGLLLKALDFVRVSLVELSHIDSTGDLTSFVSLDSESTAIELGKTQDARFICFLTGMILTHTLSIQYHNHRNKILEQIFCSWSIGLLSRSMPWRMFCAMTLCCILNLCQDEDIHDYFGSIPVSVTDAIIDIRSNAARRIWAERASFPICSRYLQSLVEATCCLYKSDLKNTDLENAEDIHEDASTPIALHFRRTKCNSASWEQDECFVCSDRNWHVWLGTVEYFPVEWNSPPITAVRSLLDAGKGPPLLREGCTVIRGPDWDVENDADGYKHYEIMKEEYENARRATKRAPETNPAASVHVESSNETNTDHGSVEMKISQPMLPIGKVLGIESWNGVPGVARRIKWDLTGKEGVYRYGGDGGKFDIMHVEVNRKHTKLVKKYPQPETAEECAVSHGFGQHHIFNIIFRVRVSQGNVETIDGEKEFVCPGIMEWPDFGAGILIELRFYCDGAISITEKKLVYGSSVSGWEARFGVPSYCPGTVYHLSETSVVSFDVLKEDGLSEEISIKNNLFEELLGSTSLCVKQLRNPEDGNNLRVGCELRLIRSKLKDSSRLDHVATLPGISFDHNYHATSLEISRDGRTVTCSSAEGKCTAFANVGFTKGVHYWEIKIEKGDIGGIFIGVAEKPKIELGDNWYERQSHLNKWVGFGYVNHRSAYTNSVERVYGSHAHAGDIIGVCLDCDAGRLSFFIDGVKYGEHILNDMGIAFENISPFGFNANGCTSGGRPNTLPRRSRYDANGKVRCTALWPVVGLRFPGDKVTITQKWMTCYGIDAKVQLRNCQRVDEILRIYSRNQYPAESLDLPLWLKSEAFHYYQRWRNNGMSMILDTRGSLPASNSLRIEVDTSPFACAVACASIGSKFVLLTGDKVRVKRSYGRTLELPEEAIILGAFENKLWYRLIQQKGEGGSLAAEGGGRAWFFDEFDAIDQSIEIIKPSSFNKIPLNLINKFKCPSCGGIEVIYPLGAVMRSDLEIIPEATSMGTIPAGTVIPEKDIFERRQNCDGVTRYLVKYLPFGQGWISSRVRGGTEEPIIRVLEGSVSSSFKSPYISASAWYNEYLSLVDKGGADLLDFETSLTQEDFDLCLANCRISGLSALQSDSLICSIVSAVSNAIEYNNPLECPFDAFISSLFHGLKLHNLLDPSDATRSIPILNLIGMENVSSMLSSEMRTFPPLKNIVCRASMLFALNRRFQYAVPFFSLYSPQENSSVLGGLSGYGSSIESIGKSIVTRSQEKWVQAPSTGTWLRKCRNLIFNRIKRDLMDDLIAVTTTPTSLSHDEYEIPRDIKTVRVNRIKAKHALSSPDKLIRKRNSVFGQLQQELQDWNGIALRRSYVAKGHGGQKRAFKVKLVGEGVNDYSGPYREVFADAFREAVHVLNIFVPSPNHSIGVGDHRNVYIFSHVDDDNHNVQVDYESQRKYADQESVLREYFATSLSDDSEQMVEAKETLTFLGKLVGIAVRHGIQVDIDLPLGTVWRPLCEENINDLEALKEIDLLSYRRVTEIYGSCINKDSYALNLLRGQKQMLNYFAEGLSSVLPVEYFSLFTAEELRDFVCGKYELDIDLLKRVVEYEGYTENDDVITYFWSVLREMTHEERKLFIQFTWARTRLPTRECDFDVPFKIQKDTKSSSNDDALPSASTCFFTLILPEYKEKEVLKEKLMFAIYNVKTMESDFVTNEAEINEGWRVFNDEKLR